MPAYAGRTLIIVKVLPSVSIECEKLFQSLLLLPTVCRAPCAVQSQVYVPVYFATIVAWRQYLTQLGRPY